MNSIVFEDKKDILAISEEIREECNRVFDMLVEKLKDTHTVVSGTNPARTRYLVPIGDENKVTWDGKPFCSLRVSNHWNWKANWSKCENDRYVQCYTKDLPTCRRRSMPGYASSPILANALAYYGHDMEYHIICGEAYDRATHKWQRVIFDMEKLMDILGEDLKLVMENNGQIYGGEDEQRVQAG